MLRVPTGWHWFEPRMLELSRQTVPESLNSDVISHTGSGTLANGPTLRLRENGICERNITIKSLAE